MSAKENMPYRLLTIPPSHFCEKARWALDYHGIEYVEEGHLPLFNRRINKKYGVNSNKVPVLLTGDRAITESTDILKFLDQGAPPERKLYPDEPGQRQKVEELEELFGQKLGPAVRRWCYFYLLPDARLSRRVMAAGRPLPRRERFFLGVGFGLLRFVMRKGMNITQAKADHSKARIFQIFEDVNGILADGRPFLVGDRFSAADLTFAALAAPALLVPENSAPLPTQAEVPAAMAQSVRDLCAMPAGQFALRLFREHRAPNSQPRSG